MKQIKIVLLLFFVFIYSNSLFAYELDLACLCEKITESNPRFKSVVFSYSIKKIYCYTKFSKIEKESFIYHVWYFKDKLISKIKLKLKPPMWATFSRIYIKSSDIGPWRVDILREDGKLLSTLRFSIVE